ncbi:MAG: carboxypeptidase-like regulatory domain-containing protein [Bacteroidales bacterium]|nr:carboxypeptidase-like regulatory domain-containing protein [Bacteroidales bacterium]
MRVACLVISLLFFISAFAQKGPQGRLTNENGAPIPYATVSLSEDSLNCDIVDYTVTNNDGHWQLSSSATEGDYITFACLGYFSKTLPARSCENVCLQTNSSSINEIVVKSRRIGMDLRNDTLVYSPEVFKTGTENNLGDVIRKLPGMEVSDGGKVSFNGKAVDKLLVNGKDILQSSGTTALNTLSADFAQSFELLQNYSNGNVAEAFSTDNPLALNIKTDKNTSSAQIDLGAGIRNKYDVKSSLFDYGDKISESVIINANNTGEPIFSILDYLRSFANFDKSAGKVQNITLNSDISRLLMPSDNQYDKNCGLANVNIDISKSDLYSSQLMILGNMSGDKARNEDGNIYLDSNIESLTRSQETNRHLFGTSQLRQKWNKDGKFSLLSATQLQASHNKMNTNAQETFNGKTLSFMQKERTTGFSVSENLTANIIVGGGLWQSSLSYGINKNSDGVTLDNKNNRNTEKTCISAQSSVTLPLFKSPFFYSLGAIAMMNREELNNRYKETLRYKSQIYHISLLRNKGLLATEGRIALHKANITATAANEETKSSLLKIEPKLSLKLRFSQQHELSFSLSNRHDCISADICSRQDWQQSYNVIYNPSKVSTLFEKTRSVSSNYFFMSLYHRTTFLMTANITDKRTPTTDTHSDVTKSLIQYTDGGYQKTFFVSSSLIKGLPAPIDTKCSFDFTRHKQNTFVYSQENIIKGNEYSWKLALTTRFTNSLVNCEMSYSQSRDNNKISPVNISTHNIKHDTEAKLILQKGKWNCFASYAYKTTDNGQKTYLHDLSAQCTYKHNSYKIQLKANNILHLSSYSWRSENISESKCSHTLYSRMPGYVMIIISKNI